MSGFEQQIAVHIDLLQQGQYYLSLVSAADYQQSQPQLALNSAGSHMRHLLDHYQALLTGLSSGVVDYDQRNRNCRSQFDPVIANQRSEQLIEWLSQLQPQQLTQPLSVQMAIANEPQQASSTLARELLFVSHHSTHHFAMIAISAKLQHYQLPEHFGLASATVSYLSA